MGDEPDQQGGRHGEGAEGAGVDPAPVGGLHHRVGGEGGDEGDEHGADEGGDLGVGIAGLPEDAEPDDDDADADGHVDQEHPPPARRCRR